MGKHGGKRQGAGRPPGANVLPYGASKGLKALRRGAPKDATESEIELAGLAEDAIRDTLNGTVHYSDVLGRLKAAGMALDRVCGPVAQKHEHSGGFQFHLTTNLGDKNAK